MGAPVENTELPGEESGALQAAEPTTHLPASEPVTQPKADELVDEKPKPVKRGSIFGKMKAGFGNIRSPVREKDQKEAELKPQVPPKDEAGVSETAPQIPEPTSTDPVKEAEIPAVAGKTAAAADVAQPAGEHKPAEAAKDKLDEIAPAGGQKGFLSGLPFMGKRGRSVSPSTPMKEQPVKKEETPIVPAKDETPLEPTPAKIEEPIVPTAPAATNGTAQTAETPLEKAAAEPKKDDITPNKRQSMLGGLGRRASKALNRMQAPQKKENVVPAGTTEPKKVEETAAGLNRDEEKPLVNGEAKAAEAEAQPSSIGDVVPDAIHTGQAQSTPTVTASA